MSNSLFRFTYLSFFLIVIFYTQTVFAQQFRAINLIQEDAQVAMMNRPDLVQKEIDKGRWDDKYYSLLYYDRKPDSKNLKFLNNIGAEVIESVSENFLMVRFKNNPSSDFLTHAGIKGVAQFPAKEKIGNALNEYINKQDDDLLIRISILLHSGALSPQFLKETHLLGFTPITEQYSNGGLFIGTILKRNLINLAALPCVKYIGLYDYKSEPLLFRESGALGFQYISSNNGGLGLSGKGVTVGIGDDADPTSHLDNQYDNYNRNPNLLIGSAHGTGVTGILSSDGLIDERYVGAAPKSTTITDFYDLIISKTQTYARDFGMTVTNNSYFIGYDKCPGNGKYNELSVYVDDQISSLDTIQHIFAAGNDGELTCSPFDSSYGTIKSGYQTSKNVLTVGNYAFSFNPRVINATSSRGPVADGRIKPEIIAPGDAIFTTSLNNTYTNQHWGTSFASPFVAGVWALLTEQYRKSFSGKNPPTGLFKAILCNSANDKGNLGPDYTHGFGLLNPRRALNVLNKNQFLIDSIVSGAQQNYQINVPTGVKQIKIMLYWHDRAGSPLASKSLQNDLDLAVTEGSNNYLPWVLNSNPSNVDEVALRAVDRINNIEQVTIDNPGSNLSLNVIGHTILGNKQTFYLTWDFINDDLQIIRPAGGEIITSGVTGEIISWDAPDSQNDSLSIEYSLNNGQTWTFIRNFDVGRMFGGWPVPANIASSQAKIKLTRFRDGATAVTPGVFTIIGLPQLNVNVVCDGAVDLLWNAIDKATDYEILQLRGNEWISIATTTDNKYSIRGLNKSVSYWFTVRARVQGAAGRRAVAQKVTPRFDTPCQSDEFNNDLTIDTLLAPRSGRQFTSRLLGNSEFIEIRLKNLDNVASSGSFEVAYQINDGEINKEVVNQIISAGTTFDYIFKAKADLSQSGNYILKLWVKQIGDTNVANDTINFLIKHIPNPPVELPFSESFEGVGRNEYLGNNFGLKDLERFDLSMNTTNGRARTFINTGVAPEGKQAITLDAAQFLGSLNTNQLIGTFNLSNILLSKGLRLDFLYKNQGQLKLPNTAMWIRGGDTYNWIKAFELENDQKKLADIQRGWVNVFNLLSGAGQPLTSSFQVMFQQLGRTSANNANYNIDQFNMDDGLTFDLLRITNASNDIILDSILSPEKISCAGQITQQSVRIKITNSGNSTLTNIPVFYRINNNTVVKENIPSIEGSSSIIYTFNTPIALSDFGNYELSVWASHPSDNYSINDSIIGYQIFLNKQISSFPYLESFETDNGGWFTDGGSYSSWTWGTTKTDTRVVLTKAAYGNKAWYTSLNETYRPNELSYLYTPCFNISSLSNPMLSFSHIFQQQRGVDVHLLEYSTDNGKSWQRLVGNNNNFNWYDTTANFWNKNIERWQVSSVELPVGASSIRFRFLLTSDDFSQFEGIGIDDFHIFEKETIYEGKNTSVSANLSGGQFVDFKAQDKVIASINPLGQNLENVNVSVYINSDSARFYKNQYYLDRNFVIKSQNELADSVLIRLYFTESDIIRMINNIICDSCIKLKDAYEAVITKYSGLDPYENNILNDGTFGSFLFMDSSKVKIAPFNNGYYAEFKVKSFSEFWIHCFDFNLKQAPITGVTDTLNHKTFIKNAMLDHSGRLKIYTGSQYNVSDMKIFIYNSSGQNIYSGIHPYRYADIGLSHLASGVYFLFITDRSGKYQFKSKFVRP